jgi:signal transduction histidine kinase
MNDNEKMIFLETKIKEMEKKYEPIIVEIEGLNFKNFVFYDESDLLKKFRYYPYVQLTAIGILMILAYWALNYTRKSEQNRLWVGLAKETAHQLGTPISGLMAWVELLKLKPQVDERTFSEMEKDILRLATVTERFSNIGSNPQLKYDDMVQSINNVIDYLSKRSSKKIKILFEHANTELKTWFNKSLFEWVIENLCKNAIDSIENKGEIIVTLKTEFNKILIEVKDNGKGMNKNQVKRIFQPGYTTKQRGWGLGLTLSKRIIEQYHKGKIFVKETEPNKGTTFRIELPYK